MANEVSLKVTAKNLASAALKNVASDLGKVGQAATNAAGDLSQLSDAGGFATKLSRDANASGRALDQLGKDADQAEREIKDLGRAGQSAGGGFSSLASSAGGLNLSLGTLAKGAAAVVAALAGIEIARRAARWLKEAAASGLSFNSSIEQAEARINSFTKDMAVTESIIAAVRKEADSTPFAFQEMAQATAGLLPAARLAGKGYDELLDRAQILAASRPEEGLLGGAFALKEALSGDFTSIIERFDLPRQYINQLKEEGVPALEIVDRAMKQMGLDASLVANLAQTLTGRWSTFLDTLRGIAAVATERLFDGLKSGLNALQGALEDNRERINDVARALGENLGAAAERVLPLLPGLVERAIGAFEGLARATSILDDLIATAHSAANAFQPLADAATNAGDALRNLTGSEEFNAFLISLRTSISGITDQMPALNSELGQLRLSLEPLAPLASAVGNAFEGAFRLLANVAAQTIGTLDDLILATVQGFTNGIQTITQLVQGLGQVAVAVVQGDWSGAWNAARETFNTFTGNVGEQVGIMEGVVSSTVSSLAQAVITTFNQMGVDVAAIMARLVTTISNQLNEAINLVNTFINRLNQIEIPDNLFGNALGGLFGRGGGDSLLNIPILQPITAQQQAAWLDPILGMTRKAEDAQVRAGIQGAVGFAKNWAQGVQETVKGLFQVEQAGTSTFQAIGNAAQTAGESAAESAKTAADFWRDAFEKAAGTVSSAVSQALDLSIGVSQLDVLESELGIYEDKVNEAGRRLEDIAQRALKGEEASPWISFFPELLGLDGKALAVSAMRLQEDIENFLRPDLLNKDAILQRAREILIGQRNKANLIEELTQQLIGEGFAAPEILQALGDTLGGAVGGGIGEQLAAAFTQGLQPFQEQVAPQLAQAAEGVIAPAVETATDATDSLWQSIVARLQPAAEAFMGGAALTLGERFGGIEEAIRNALAAFEDFALALTNYHPPALPAPVVGVPTNIPEAPGRALGGVVREPMTWVGERGPELVALPGGSRVYPSGLSMQMAARQPAGMTLDSRSYQKVATPGQGVGGGIEVNLGGVTVDGSSGLTEKQTEATVHRWVHKHKGELSRMLDRERSKSVRR